MVKAKRSKPVSLTKVKGKKKDLKEKLSQKLSDMGSEYNNVYVIEVTNQTTEGQNILKENL